MKSGEGSCQARRLNKERFEQAVVEEIKKHILTPANLIELVRLVNDDLDKEASELEVLFESISKECKEVQRRLGRLYDALETGKLGMNDLAPRIKELRVREAELELKKVELQTKLSDRHVEFFDRTDVEEYIADMHGLLETSELAKRKAFIRSFVKEITVVGDEVRVIYSMPALDKQTYAEEESVLPIVHVGGRLKIRTSDPSLIRTVL